MWPMSRGKRGLYLNKKNYLSVSRPLSFHFFLAFIFLTMIYFLFTNYNDETELYATSSIFKNKKIFSHLDKAEEISYVIRSRESLDRNNIHRLYFQVEVPKGINREQLVAGAQKIVKETISYELCHSIKIDFDSYGHVDFAPYGDWTRAGEIPINHYRNYRFKYVFSSFLPQNKGDS